ncbi:CGNR zinc finger domain-containing protein [Roseibium sp.]|uniref:CGNR zinc finger domain-containing protein n=1 Tax=Roseibium sp. TaxID=1936156 RepID=UPI003B525944
MWAEENFIAGHPALDFLNTVSDVGKSRTENRLQSPTDLAEWVAACGAANRFPVDRSPTDKDVQDVVRFREAAYEALCARLGSTAKSEPAYKVLEAYLKAALQRASLNLAETPAVWTASRDAKNCFTDSFALLVHDLLQSPELHRLRQCERCTWFFLNTGRGRGRRWCNMATCGNRAKVEAHRQRARQSVNQQ